jgi:probable O-glycosylation ligase (exosortase A-associated)
MIRNYLFIVIMFVLFGAAIATPFGALQGYLWFALFRPQDWVWFDISQFRLSLLLGCFLLFRCFTTKAWPNISHPISIGMIAFLLTGLIAQGNAVNPALGWYWLDFFFRLTIVTLLLITLVNTERRFFWTVLTISSSLGYYTAKAGLASLLGGGGHFFEGLSGAFSDSNAYALAGTMIIPMLLAVATNAPEEWRCRKLMTLGYRVAVPLTAFLIISTFSRGGLLALGAVLFAFLILHRNRFTILAVLILLSVVVYPFVPIPDGYMDRITTITTYEEVEETSALSRLHFWRVGWDMAVDNPLGVGMFNSGPTYNRYDFSDGLYGKNRVMHSSHFQVLAEQGFVGFAIWGWLFISSFRSCFRIRRLAMVELFDADNIKFYESMTTALIISMFAFLVGGSFISLALNDLTWLTFGLVVALEQLYNKSKTLNQNMPGVDRQIVA